jgi:hypothetical protein
LPTPNNCFVAAKKFLALPGVDARPFITANTCAGLTPVIGSPPHALPLGSSTAPLCRAFVACLAPPRHKRSASCIAPPKEARAHATAVQDHRTRPAESLTGFGRTPRRTISSTIDSAISGAKGRDKR